MDITITSLPGCKRHISPVVRQSPPPPAVRYGEGSPQGNLVAAFSRAVAAVSRRLIGLATHHTLGNDAFAKAGPIQDLDLLITDEEAEPEAIERIHALGVKVILT